MQGITRFGLDATRITLVFITLVLVAGLAQFLSYPRLEDPAITIREVVVSAHFPGMKPEDIEQLITREIEAELRGMHEIEDIWSESKTGTATIHADTSDEVEDVIAVWQKVRNRMADLAPKLPSGTKFEFLAPNAVEFERLLPQLADTLIEIDSQLREGLRLPDGPPAIVVVSVDPDA